MPGTFSDGLKREDGEREACRDAKKAASEKQDITYLINVRFLMTCLMTTPPFTV